MQFPEVSAEKVTYIELRCGNDHTQIPWTDDLCLEVDEEIYICLNMKSNRIAKFLCNTTQLRSLGRSGDRLLDFQGLHELKELRNAANNSDEPTEEALFDNAPKKTAAKKASPKKASVDWPQSVEVNLANEDWPNVRLLRCKSRSNEFVWVHSADLGIVISFLKLKGLHEIVQSRSRHELPVGIQARKKLRTGETTTVYVVTTKGSDGLQYSQFNTVEDAVAFQQSQGC